MINRLVAAVVLLAWLWLPATGLAQTLGTTDFRGALVGPYAASQMGIGMYGTDLGIAVGYAGQLRVLFGDTWKDGNATGLGGLGGADDSQGNISLTTFGTGDAVDNWLNNSSRKQTPQWRTDGPTLSMELNLFGVVAPLAVFGSNGAILAMGLGRTPVAGFANKKTTTGGVFSFFNRAVAMLCTSTNSCGTGFTCDTNMGTCNAAGDENAQACVIGTTRCLCAKPVGYVGVCQDRTSSVYDTTEDGRLLSQVLRDRVGNADPSVPAIYYTQEFLTNKFVTVTSRTVRDFLPTRTYDSSANIYSPATGAAGGNEKVFLWSRPNAAGFGSWKGKSSKLYFAYVDMPSYNSAGAFPFAPKYFSGFGSSGCTSGQAAPDTTHNYPCFGATQNTAIPLNLSATGGDNTAEALDINGSHTVAWVPAISKFVMIYGGDYPDGFLSLGAGPNWTHLTRNPNGAMYFRYSTYPVGPWSAPVPVVQAGTWNPATGQYASGGSLYSPNCSGTCAAMDPYYALLGQPDRVGRLYSPQLVEEWTMTRGTNTADLYWFVSTWDPYQVLIMRTRVNP